MSPQLSLSDFDESGLRDLSDLTETERGVYLSLSSVKAFLFANSPARRTVGPVPSAICSNARVYGSTIARGRCRIHGERAS